MSERALKQLVGALAVVVGLWIVASLLSRGGGAIDATSDVGATFEGVDPGSVTAVRFINPADTVVLRPAEGSWTVNGLRADSGSVARFFEAVGAAETSDLVATNPANHERMGLAGDSLRVLEIEVAGETRSIVVGNTGPRASTAYVRQPTEDAVYLLEGGIRSHVVRRLNDWRNRRILAIDTSQVSRIAVEREGDAFTLVRADTAWTFVDGSPTVDRQIRSMLQELGGAFVAAGFFAEGDVAAEQPPAGTTVAYSESGDVLAEVEVGSGTGERWTMAAGDTVRYRIASFRANLIVPTRESMTPE